MVKWFIIILSLPLLLLVVEESSSFFLKRYLNKPGEKKASILKERFMTYWGKLKVLLNKYKKDPSH